jgi:hypothetical protein
MKKVISNIIVGLTMIMWVVLLLKLGHLMIAGIFLGLGCEWWAILTLRKFKKYGWGKTFLTVILVDIFFVSWLVYFIVKTY